MKQRWEGFKKWALDKPVLKVCSGFLAIEGMFEGTLITIAAIAYFGAGNYWLAALFTIWALWEVFARYYVVKTVV